MSEEIKPIVSEENPALDSTSEIEAERDFQASVSYRESKLREDLPFRVQRKKEELVSEYHGFVNQINVQSAQNAEDEARLMGEFSDQIDRFNEARIEFIVAMTLLKTEVKED